MNEDLDLAADFFDESIDSLQHLAEHLEAYQRNPDDREPIHQVFRAIHTIKGNSGFFGMKSINGFSHSLEHTLDALRNDSLRLSDDLHSAVIDSFDLLEEMLESAAGGALDADPPPEAANLIARLRSAAEQCRVADAQPAEPQGDDGSGPDTLNELDPASLVGRTFSCQGQDVTPQVDRLVGFFVDQDEGRRSRELREGFLQSIGELADWVAEADEDEQSRRLLKAASDFEILHTHQDEIDPGLLTLVWEQLCPALAELLDERDGDGQDPPATAVPGRGVPTPGRAPKKSNHGAEKTVRVKERQLDDFGADVAALFVTCEQLKELQSRIDRTLGQDRVAKEFRDLNAAFVSQVTSLEQRVAALRKVPIRPLLAKVSRLARTLATDLGKKVNVRLEGAETEVDKTLLEDLDAPLVHMVRNAVDHGLETPREREARGAEETGNLWVKTALSQTHVVLTIRDDGRGIDPDKIRKKALEKGVASEAELHAMPDQEALGLIFHPGLSTAEKITDVSGRGVGLDVVQSNIRKHNGDIKVESRPGAGTTFRVEIPIRRIVVVIDSLVVEHAATAFAVPFKHIDRILECDAADLSTVRGSAVITNGKRCVPAVPLGALLQLDFTPPTDMHRTPVLLVGTGKDTVGLVVDRIVGRKKVVVNDISGLVEGAEKFSGVAQLGGERLALVLNVPELMAASAKRRFTWEKHELIDPVARIRRTRPAEMSPRPCPS